MGYKKDISRFNLHSVNEMPLPRYKKNIFILATCLAVVVFGLEVSGLVYWSSMERRHQRNIDYITQKIRWLDEKNKALAGKLKLHHYQKIAWVQTNWELFSQLFREIPVVVGARSKADLWSCDIHGNQMFLELSSSDANIIKKISTEIHPMSRVKSVHIQSMDRRGGIYFSRVVVTFDGSIGANQ